MKVSRILFLQLILVVSFTTISCITEKPSKVTPDIFGKYFFEFPTKEFELLTINIDSTFTQKIYLDYKSFKNDNKPLYSNKGSWSTVKNELIFNGWLSYCFLLNPENIRSSPKKINLHSVYWHRHNIRHSGIISVYDENGFFFQHIDDLEDR
ncbi:MAG: hypothetical protein PSN34_03925 [Urechidicola sp.]|nr:hypothetical protein [Urechidicola sp.]